MKITLLSPAYPLRGGISNFANQLAYELSKSNNVDIITFKRQYPNILFPGKTQFEDNTKTPNSNTRILVDSINPFNWISVGKIIREEKPDYLLISYWMPFFAPCLGVISRIVRKKSKTKIVAICHNVLPHESKPGDKILTKYFFKYVNKFILLSAKVKDDLLSLKYTNEYKILFHPIYSTFGEIFPKVEARKHLNINTSKVILFFGFIREYKGLDTLLHAMEILKTQNDIILIVAGEFYENEEKYNNIIEKHDLKNFVLLFNDFIPADEVKYYFSAADLVVLPYKDATQSGVTQIAKHFKRPIISTNVGGLAEVVKNGVNGFLVEKENPTALANAILNYYSNDLEETFEKNIESELEEYSWKKFASEMLK